MINKKKIIMLTGESISSTYFYNGLKENFNISKIVVEKKLSRYIILKKRIIKLGLITVFGQILFRIFVPKRLSEIKSYYKLKKNPIPNNKIIRINSVNSNECINILKKEKPDLIIVNGTRIISKKILKCINTHFINTHTGITPMYRGVHGGYWAMANNDKNNFGVTVHMVNSGIDTGKILMQKKVLPSLKDNYVTYPYIQIGEGIIILNKITKNFMKDKINEFYNTSMNESNLWYHPTIWFYIYNRIMNNIK